MSVTTASAAIASDAQKQDAPEPPKIFNSEDFMSWLQGQEIKTLAVLTKSGTLVSASFDNCSSSVDPGLFASDLFKSMESRRDSAVFRSFDFFKSMDTPPSLASNGSQALGKAAADAANGHSMFKSSEWKAELAPTHVDVSYNHFFSRNEEPAPDAAADVEPESEAPNSDKEESALPPKKKWANKKTDWKAVSRYRPVVQYPFLFAVNVMRATCVRVFLNAACFRFVLL